MNSKPLNARAEQELALRSSHAYDFDPRDPLFGLDKQRLCGPRLERRAVLRLLAASGTLSALHLMPGGLAKPAAAARTAATCGRPGPGSARSSHSIRHASTRWFSSRSPRTC